MSSFESDVSHNSSVDETAYNNNNHANNTNGAGLRFRRGSKLLPAKIAVEAAGECAAKQETWQRGSNQTIPTVTEKLEKDCEMIMQVGVLSRFLGCAVTVCLLLV